MSRILFNNKTAENKGSANAAPKAALHPNPAIKPVNSMDWCKVQLSDSEFKLYQDLIYKECRIALKPIKKTLLMGRLRKRLRECECKDFKEYYKFVTSPEGRKHEFNRMIDCITTNKTEFFREIKHFDFLRDKLWAEMIKRNSNGFGRAINVWSSACSSGEEPYTIAIHFLEAAPQNNVKLEITASDISERMLDTAREGIYSQDKLETISKNMLVKHFIKGNERYKVKDHIKKMVKFEKINLNHDFTKKFKNKFDLIFCRNVIIYFDKQTQAELMARYYHCLKPEGFLFLGHSESMHGISDQYKFITSSVYQKI